MEEDRVLSRLRNQDGVALVLVLLAIVVLLPLTLVLSSFAIQWQRQSLDYRDTISEEFAAHSGFEEARNRIAADGLDLEPNQGSAFVVEELEEFTASVRVSREADVVLTQTGHILDDLAGRKADLERTGVDAEGRIVYQFRKLEIFVVQVDVSRRPTLPAVRLQGVIAVLPDNSIQTLGTQLTRGYF